MKTSLKSLLLAVVAGFGALSVNAQTPTPKIVVFNLAKAFEQYYRTVEMGDSLKKDQAAALSSLKDMDAERTQWIAQLQVLVDTLNAPTTSDDKKATTRKEAEALNQRIIERNNSLQGQINLAQNNLQNKFNVFKEEAISSICDVARDLAKQKNANMLLDNSKNSVFGTTTLIWVDNSYYDLTDDVVASINKGHAPPAVSSIPAGAPAMPGTFATPTATKSSK